MGAFLDSAQDIRKNEKSPPGQAHKTEEKLEKDKDKGVKMLKQIIPENPSARITSQLHRKVVEMFSAKNREYDLIVIYPASAIDESEYSQKKAD